MSNIPSHAYLPIEVINMNIELSLEEQLIIMDSLLHSYLNSKMYYKDHSSKDDRIGLMDQEEILKTYNKILAVAKESGEYKILELIK
jgi:hypothetical protein